MEIRRQWNNYLQNVARVQHIYEVFKKITANPDVKQMKYRNRYFQTERIKSFREFISRFTLKEELQRNSSCRRKIIPHGSMEMEERVKSTEKDKYMNKSMVMLMV